MQIEHNVEGWPAKERMLARFIGESVGDFIAHAKSDEVGHRSNSKEIQQTKAYVSGHVSWAGAGCEALELWLSEGRPETIVAIEAMKERLATEAPAAFSQTAPRRRRMRGLDCGEEADLDRFTRRDLNCWEEMRREPMARRMVTLGIPMLVSACVRPSEMQTRGAAGIALADWLTAQGYAVRIIGFALYAYVARGRHGWAVQEVEIKRANAPLDLAAVATAACESAYTRCALLPSLARGAAFALDPVFGRPADPTPEQRAFLGLDLVVPESACYAGSAARWLSEVVRAVQSGELLNPEGGIATGKTAF